MRMRVLFAVGAMVASTVGTVVSPAVSSSAEPVVAEGLAGFADIQPDPTHDRLFISQATDTVVMVSPEGDVIGKIGGLHGAIGMALTEDAATLWVALSDGDAVAAVDTESLEVVEYPTGTATCPSTVALTAGTVWFSYGCGGWGGVGAVDPSTGNVTLGLTELSHDNAALATSPVLPGRLFLAESNSSPATLYSYAAEGGATPSLTLDVKRWDIGGDVSDLIISPDGGKILAAGVHQSKTPLFRTSDLSGTGAYHHGDRWSEAAAFRADGMVAVGVDGFSDGDPELYVYPPGTDEELASTDLGDDEWFKPHALAFLGDRLYAVTWNRYEDPEYRLWVIEPRPEPRLMVETDRRTYAYGETATVTATLRGPAAGYLRLYAEPIDGEGVLVAEGPVGPDGTLTGTYTPDHRTVFSAEFDGDDTYAPTTAAISRQVGAIVTARMTGWLTTYGRVHLYRIGRAAIFDATVMPEQPGTCVYFRIQTRTGDGWSTNDTSRCIALDDNSAATGSIEGGAELRGVRMRLRAMWSGNSRNGPGHSEWQYFRFVR